MQIKLDLSFRIVYTTIIDIINVSLTNIALMYKWYAVKNDSFISPSISSIRHIFRRLLTYNRKISDDIYVVG